MDGDGAHRRGRPLQIDLTDCMLGGVHVIDRAQDRPKSHVYWNCMCPCGNIFQAQTFDLMSGRIRSCGCYRDEIFRRRKEYNRTRS